MHTMPARTCIDLICNFQFGGPSGVKRLTRLENTDGWLACGRCRHIIALTAIISANSTSPNSFPMLFITSRTSSLSSIPEPSLSTVFQTCSAKQNDSTTERGIPINRTKRRGSGAGREHRGTWASFCSSGSCELKFGALDANGFSTRSGGAGAPFGVAGNVPRTACPATFDFLVVPNLLFPAATEQRVTHSQRRTPRSKVAVCTVSLFAYAPPSRDDPPGVLGVLTVPPLAIKSAFCFWSPSCTE